jgi:CTP synthase (UTP-ammonia lyase)
MRKARRIAVIGERDLKEAAHAGIEASMALFRAEVDPRLEYEWIATPRIAPDSVDRVLGAATGVWCAPGSPYESTAGALLAIRHARVPGKSFLGTCGGFQHALMEFAGSVLGREAVHQELDASARNPLIAKLSCSLVGAIGKVLAVPGDRYAEILGAAESTEEYKCNYGLNSAAQALFSGSGLTFVAFDESGQVRAFRLEGHPFFFGTLFQPERKALAGSLHPVVRAFLESA